MRGTALRRRGVTEVLLLVVFVMVSAGIAFAAGVPLTDDATTSSTSPNTPVGSGTSISVSSGKKAFLKFDISVFCPWDYCPYSDEVARAILIVYVNGMLHSGCFDVREVLGSWSEGTITHNNAPSLGSTVGSGCVSASGKFVAADVTEAIVHWFDYINEWDNGAIPNYGLALVPQEENGSTLSASFDSKENTLTSHPVQLFIDTIISIAF